MVYVTALPCKILITTFAICLYMFITINNNKYEKICTSVTIHVKKQHNKELRHIIEMLSMVIKDLLLHKCPLLTDCLKPKFALLRRLLPCQ